MDNPEQIQLLTTDQSREESERNRDALEKSADVEKIKKVTVSVKRYYLTIIALVVIIVALMIAVLTTMLLTRTSGENSQKLETCWSKECMEIAYMLKNYQNPDMDPCEDFFEHTCGHFHEHSRDDSDLLSDEMKILLYQVFSTVRKTEKFNSRPKEQLRIFANKCIDRVGMDNDTLEELRNDIEMRGGFPMIDENWDESKFDLSDMLSKYMSINRKRMPFLSVEAFNSVENGTVVNLLYLSPGPHHVDIRAQSVEKYKESVAFMVERLLKLENRTLDWAKYGNEFQEVVDLESTLMKLANYGEVKVDTDDMSKAKNLSDLAKMIPEIDWFKIVRALPREKMTKEEEEKFIRKIRVHGGGEYFFGEKRELAQIATTTPKRILANYIVVRQLIDVALYYYDQDQPRQDKFFNYQNQQTFCTNQLARFFPMPSMNIYLEQSKFKMKNLEIVEKIFKELKEVYVEMFNEAKWLEPEIREILIRKVQALKAKFGMKEYMEGEPLLEKMYETLDFQETDSPYQIYMKMWRHRTEQLVEHIMHNTPLNPVNMAQFAPYAYYQSYGNILHVNAAYLAAPWFDADFPISVNYAYMGWAVGHEMGHAFDYFHRKIDENGVKQRFWSTNTNSSNIEYEKREKCMRDQYSNYKQPGYDFFMNGTISRQEIVADQLGTKAAFRVFKNAQKSNTAKLPGLDGVSPEQMFFYSHAVRLCDVYGKTILDKYLKARSHPTYRFRVNGVYQNIPEFSEAFQCGMETTMNLQNKCTLF